MSDQKKLEWIYSGVGGLVDDEEYLTGRRIDKTFLIAQQERTGQSLLDQNEFALPNAVSGAPEAQFRQLDLASKAREDPLVKIQQHQLEKRREILNNPLKIRRLRKLLVESIRLDREQRKMERKLRRKLLKKQEDKCNRQSPRKQERRSSTSSSSDNREDSREKPSHNVRHAKRSRSPSSNDKRVKRSRSPSYDQRRSKSTSPQHKRQLSPVDRRTKRSSSRQRLSPNGKHVKLSKSPSYDRHRSRSKNYKHSPRRRSPSIAARRTKRSRSNSRQLSPKRRQLSPDDRGTKRSRSPSYNRHRSRSTSPQRRRKLSPVDRRTKPSSSRQQPSPNSKHVKRFRSPSYDRHRSRSNNYKNSPRRRPPSIDARRTKRSRSNSRQLSPKRRQLSPGGKRTKRPRSPSYDRHRSNSRSRQPSISVRRTKRSSSRQRYPKRHQPSPNNKRVGRLRSSSYDRHRSRSKSYKKYSPRRRHASRSRSISRDRGNHNNARGLNRLDNHDYRRDAEPMDRSWQQAGNGQHQHHQQQQSRLDRNDGNRRPRLAEEEMEARRQAMLSDGKWREEHRQRDIQRYKMDEEREKAEIIERQRQGGFIRPMIGKMPEHESIEMMVKQNVFSAQRGYDAMSKNFARR